MQKSLPILGGLMLMAHACGGTGTVPTMQGREGMLSKTAIKQKCEEAAEDHLRPFVVEWDATDLASFEAKAASRTVVVRYEGCKLVPLYECTDPVNPTVFGSYGHPHFTSGTVQGIDIANESQLYASLPLGAVNLSGRVRAGERLHLKYFVSGVATSSRDALYRGELQSYPGCAEATHFVWAFNLGAFELQTSEGQEAGASVGAFGLGASGKHRHAESSLGMGGKLANCETQDQRACRVPIRLALRSIKEGQHPAGAAVPVLPPDPSLAGPPIPHSSAAAAANLQMLQEKMAVNQAAQVAYVDANRKLNENLDGKACLKSLDRMLRLDPRSADIHSFRLTRVRCLMRAGRCADGMRDARAHLAAKDVKRIKSDEMLDAEVRTLANRECNSAQAKNDADFVIRAARELTRIATQNAKDGQACRKIFNALHKRIPRLKPTQADMQARGRGLPALQYGSFCVAEAEGCKAGFALYQKYYRVTLKGMSNIDNVIRDSWKILRDQGQIKCK